MSSVGLSPLTRGNLIRTAPTPCRSGSIPAHAGKPRWGIRVSGTTKVYPRSRGETGMPCTKRNDWSGLSPLTRGNLEQRPLFVESCGSIPAHAGKPDTSKWRTTIHRVYPRSRGETPSGGGYVLHFPGLSPLTRGNHLPIVQRIAIHGSIPAHAGKPS